MATNPNVLVNREKYIGSSEISTILGINPFMTRWKLLQLKAGLIEDEFEGNEYTEYGDIMEPKIRNYINTLHPVEYSKTPFIEDTIVQEEEIISRRCNYDGLSKTHCLEIKTTSQIHNNVRDYKRYLVQLLWGMILSKRKKGLLAVYERPNNFDTNFNFLRLKIYEIDIKDYQDWIEEIEEAVVIFKQDLVKLKENPFLSEADLLPKELMELSSQIDVFEEVIKQNKRVEEEYKRIKEKLVDAMQEYNFTSWKTPKDIRITLVKEEDKEIEKICYDEEKFKKENQELYENYHNKLEEYKEVKKEIKKGKSAYLKITLPK